MDTPAALIKILETATPDELAHIASLLSVRLSAAVGAGALAETEVTEVRVPAERTCRPKKKVKRVFALPMTPDGTAPPESAYRLNSSDIRNDVCLARKSVCPDKRWTIAIYAEAQCGRSCVSGTNLCAGCTEKKARYDVCPSYHSWNGMITEPPLEWQHMLGTAWATQQVAAGRLRWMGFVAAGGAGSSSDMESLVSSDASSSFTEEEEASEKEAAAQAAARAARAAQKEAARAAKAAEKKAAAELKAKMAAEKEAEKAALAVQKEAEKAALAVQKEAEKAALLAQKEAEKAALLAQKETEKAAKAALAAEKEALKAAQAAEKEALKAAQAAEKEAAKAQKEAEKAAKAALKKTVTAKKTKKE